MCVLRYLQIEALLEWQNKGWFLSQIFPELEKMVQGGISTVDDGGQHREKDDDTWWGLLNARPTIVEPSYVHSMYPICTIHNFYIEIVMLLAKSWYKRKSKVLMRGEKHPFLMNELSKCIWPNICLGFFYHLQLQCFIICLNYDQIIENWTASLKNASQCKIIKKISLGPSAKKLFKNWLLTRII